MMASVSGRSGPVHVRAGGVGGADGVGAGGERGRQAQAQVSPGLNSVIVPRDHAAVLSNQPLLDIVLTEGFVEST